MEDYGSIFYFFYYDPVDTDIYIYINYLFLERVEEENIVANNLLHSAHS